MLFKDELAKHGRPPPANEGRPAIFHSTTAASRVATAACSTLSARAVSAAVPRSSGTAATAARSPLLTAAKRLPQPFLLTRWLLLLLAACELLSPRSAVEARSSCSRLLKQVQPLPLQQPQLLSTATPPPPAGPVVGSAGTSLEFFQLLYTPNVSEIRITRDITLFAHDAATAAADHDIYSTLADSSDPEAAAPAAEALGIGMRAPLLTSNLTVVGTSEGGYTRLNFNFVSAVVRLRRGVRLTFRKLEVFKALNHVGQAVDFMGRSEGGVVVFQDCIQRRPVCVNFPLALAQILSLPPASDPELVRQQGPRDVALRNNTEVCWTTSALLSTCKKEALEARSLAVTVTSADGVLGDSGGYDVYYNGSRIVCENQVEAACLRTTPAERCFAQEIASRWGNTSTSPDWRGGNLESSAGEGGSGGGGGGPSARTVGLAAGIGGGGGLLAFLSLMMCAVLLTRRRRRLSRLSSKGGRGGGGSAADDGSRDRDPRFLVPRESDDISRGVEAAAVVLRRKTSAAGAALDADADTGAGTDDGGGGGGGGAGGGGGGSAGTSSSARGASGSKGGLYGSGGSVNFTPPAALAAAPSAAGFSRTTFGSASSPSDVESIRRSLLGGRNPEAPLNVQVLQLLGEGSFGKVYKGIWQGTLVALKALVLSGNLTQDQRRRQMAVMEAAISSAMSHPNIVQTYTYSFRAIKDGGASGGTGVGSSSNVGGSGGCGSGDAGGGGGGIGGRQEIGPARASEDTPEPTRIYGHELLLVLEYCDRGSLRQALDAGIFHRGYGWGAVARPSPAAAPAPHTAATGLPRRSGDGAKGGGGGCEESSYLTPAAEFSTLTGPPPNARGPSDGSSGGVGVGGGGGTAAGGGAITRDTGACSGEASGRLAKISEQRRFGPSSDERRAYNYGLMLQVACDVASAMLHLHSHGVVHGDIKASNVLLKTSAPSMSDSTPRMLPAAIAARATSCSGSMGGGGGLPPAAGAGGGGGVGRGSMSTATLSPMSSVSTNAWTLPSIGFTAKVADFGLSTVLGFEGDTELTHISALTAQGSLTHMAPELMLHGHISKRVDVYAFGILLFELFSGERAHRGVPRALLPHQVAICGLRPALSPHTPPDYRRLAEACWQAEPTKRPNFEAILAELNRMRTDHLAASAAAAAATGGGSFPARGYPSSTTTTTPTASNPTCSTLGPSATAAALDYEAQPDGWVTVPCLEATTCDSELYAELLRTTDAGGVGDIGGGGKGGEGEGEGARGESEGLTATDVPSIAEPHIAGFSGKKD